MIGVPGLVKELFLPSTVRFADWRKLYIQLASRIHVVGSTTSDHSPRLRSKQLGSEHSQFAELQPAASDLGGVR